MIVRKFNQSNSKKTFLRIDTEPEKKKENKPGTGRMGRQLLKPGESATKDCFNSDYFRFSSSTPQACRLSLIVPDPIGDDFLDKKNNATEACAR
ncbi:hypothetical protein RRG08_051418 [Elysia crispata]|uniref:Uncharacterized protein n=1 Tax=Elysia crispata TaxID=231223 RepID=A0AAE1B446_9GAST|nr:hypothetical protein RRG08_051418 [Elysia crispata]